MHVEEGRFASLHEDSCYNMNRVWQNLCYEKMFKEDAVPYS